MILYPSDDDIDVHLGETTWIELLKRGKDRATRVEEVRRIVEAIVDGRFEETVWRVGGKLVRSKSVIFTPEGKAFLKPREWRGVASLLPDPRAKRIQFKYEPYS